MDFLLESNLSRVIILNEEHEAAAISAYTLIPELNNRKQTKKLLEDLKKLNKKYPLSIIDIEGVYTYMEGDKQATKVSERGFWVTNLSDYQGFWDDIAYLGEKYYQESVLLVPKAAFTKYNDHAFLYYTNGPNKGKMQEFNGTIKIQDMNGELYGTKVKNKIFVITNPGEVF